MTSPAHFISATADDDDVPFSGTCLVFTLGVATPLQVDGVNARFFDFANEEHRRGTIVQDFGSLSVARYELDHNPYATIIELEDRIKLLLRALNDIYLQPAWYRRSLRFHLEGPSGRWRRRRRQRRRWC